MSAKPASSKKKSASGLILFTLAAGQFLMVLDSTVMNVSMATVAKDVGTSVTGIQQAITTYTLVMATLMITGAKVGAKIGRKRAFGIGCVIYGCGSLLTSLSQSLEVLMIGWSFLEGIGAALIMPAIVALVASNFPRERRATTYGLIAAAAAMAVAAGPIIGGFTTTYFSWRWIFAAEFVSVFGLLALSKRITDTREEKTPPLDFIGIVLSAAALGAFVYGVLRTGEWGWIQSKPGEPSIGSVSMSLWLMIAGLFLMWVFFRWESHMLKQGKEPLVRPAMLGNEQLRGGLIMFFFQYLAQAGLFFVLPLYLSIALGLSALDTGVHLLPLSIGLLVTAIGVPKFLPQVSPRRVVRVGIFALLFGTVILLAALTPTSGAEIVIPPLLIAGLGMGALASQLGAVTVSALPDSQSSEVGGLQNTATNLGASLGTAIAGSIVIAAMTASFLTGIEGNPAIPNPVKSEAQVQLTSGIPFISDDQLQSALKKSDVPKDQISTVTTNYEESRIKGLRTALGILALLSLLALFMVGPIPAKQPSVQDAATG